MVEYDLEFLVFLSLPQLYTTLSEAHAIGQDLHRETLPQNTGKTIRKFTKNALNINTKNRDHLIIIRNTQALPKMWLS